MKDKLKSLAVLGILVPLLTACPKPKAPAPEPDTELQSTIDASFANFTVTDIEMICSFMGEGMRAEDMTFYNLSPEEDPSKLNGTNNPDADQKVVSFNSARCRDGHVRDGSIFLRNPNTDPNARYYRNYNYHGTVTLESYKVDGWQIRLKQGTACHIYNRLSSSVFNAAQTQLSWSIEGSFEFIHPTDPSKNMSWSGTLIKTLANTSDVNVYNPSKPQDPIRWSLARVEYRGELTGVTTGDVPYKLEINEHYPLTRDFECYPDIVGGVESVQPFKTWKEEAHPFKTGIMYFTTGKKYPREVFYGNEANTFYSKEDKPYLPLQCDNTGQVLIQGNSYPVNFMK